MSVDLGLLESEWKAGYLGHVLILHKSCTRPRDPHHLVVGSSQLDVYSTTTTVQLRFTSHCVDTVWNEPLLSRAAYGHLNFNLHLGAQVNDSIYASNSID